MANFNSNLITAGQQVPSIPPGTTKPVFGSVVIAANTTLTNLDTLSLFTMPGPSSHIVGGWFDFPILDSTNTLRLKFFDGTNNIIASTKITTWSAAQQTLIETNQAGGLLGSGVSYVGGAALGPLTLSVTTTSGASIGVAALTLFFAILIGMD